MSVAERRPLSIAKELVSELRFPSKEVLKNPDDIRRRKTELERAALLGNVEKCKVRIIFEDEVSLRMVETTIWAVTDERVVLKGGVVIPMCRIVEVIV
jgi:hypothetical protein